MPFLDSGNSSIEVTPGELLVGSGAQATWRVLNSDLAARHFTLKVMPDGSATVKPYSASTIVVVNGAAVDQGGVPISVGDTLAAGSARFAYVDDLEAPRAEFDPASVRPAYLIEEGERQAYPLSKRTISIGRDVGAGIPLRDPAVSRFHADIRSEAGEFVLYAMGSAGTHVNDQRVATPKVLAEGDVIRIGSSNFRYARGELPAGVTRAKIADQEEDALARRSTVTLRTVRSSAGGEDTGDHAAADPQRPRLMMVVAGTVVLLAAAAYFVFGQN